MCLFLFALHVACTAWCWALLMVIWSLHIRTYEGSLKEYGSVCICSRFAFRIRFALFGLLVHSFLSYWRLDRARVHTLTVYALSILRWCSHSVFHDSVCTLYSTSWAHDAFSSSSSFHEQMVRPDSVFAAVAKAVFIRLMSALRYVTVHSIMIHSRTCPVCCCSLFKQHNAFCLIELSFFRCLL